MKALQYKTFGTPEVLEITNLSVPQAGFGQVRVKVSAVGLNPMDWLIVGNERMAQNFGVKLPQIFAYDFSGLVDAVGEGVTGFAVGDRVFGTTYNGAAAEQIVVSVLPTARGHLFHTPSEISDEIAATLGVAGMTAAVAVRKVRVGPMDTVLIGGASGGVGVFAVQLAKLAGARRVIGTASDSTAGFLAELGAEQVAYGPGLVERIKDLGITAAVDLFSHETLEAALAVGVPAEKITTVLMFPAPPAGVSTSTGGEGTDEEMQQILEALITGKLTVPIAGSFQLGDFRKAIELQSSRHAHGKVILTLGENK